MLAVRKHTIEPVMNARTATLTMTGRLLGAIVPNVATTMPNELGLANPQMA